MSEISCIMRKEYNSSFSSDQEAAMGTFIDFADVKAKVSFAETVALLKLDLKSSGNQWRGPCPACNAGGERALVVTEGRGFFCFSLKKGGDQIALAADVTPVSHPAITRVLG
jgi:hypothetical protein